MTDRPILISGPMVRALMDGRKTQTRRICKYFEDEDPCLEPPVFYWHKGRLCTDHPDGGIDVVTKYQIGDRLWVRETFRCNGWATDVATIFYKAHEQYSYTEMCEQWPIADHKSLPVDMKWRPSIHMPRWASRLTLIVTDVRVQRLQDISEGDAVAEGGVSTLKKYPDGGMTGRPAKFDFMCIWNQINEASGTGWIINPWVVALSFDVVKQNIDAIEVAS